MDHNKVIKVSTVPIGILVAIGIFSNVAGLVLPALLCVVGLPLTIAGWAVTAWAGYKAVKEEKMELVGGVIVGAFTGAVAALINAIIGFILGMIGIGAYGGGAEEMAFGAIGGIIGIVFAPIVGAILGAILGAIGAFVGQMK